jgi:hypothetical protein
MEQPMKTSVSPRLAAIGAAAMLACTGVHAALRDAVSDVQADGTSVGGASLSTLMVSANGSNGSASAVITYYFEVSGAPLGTIVPIVISGDWAASAFGSGVAAGQVTTGLDLTHGSFTRDLVFSCSEQAPCGGGPYHVHEQVLAGYEWTILFSASGVAGALGTFQSQVDPVITVDPSFAGATTIEFSPNLPGVAAAVPEPGTAASMVAGLLLLMRRLRLRRRAPR